MGRHPVCSIRAMRLEVSSGAFWRDILSEFFATFMLVSIQCVLPLTWGKDGGFSQAVMTGLGMGFIVATMAWSLGDFGGAHMNPAVTFAMTLSLKMSIIRALFYVIAQVAGGLAGAGFAFTITPTPYHGNLAATTLGPDVTLWQGFLTEAWITCILVITIFGSTNSVRKNGNLNVPPFIIGLAVALCIFAAWNHTGASMNPARSLGPAVMMGIWKDHWVYWAGPLAGGAVAALFYVAIFDRVDIQKFGSCDIDKYEMETKGDDDASFPSSDEDLRVIQNNHNAVSTRHSDGNHI